MTFYDNVDWIGFLVENVIRKCVSLTATECSGCIDGMKSDILHLHHQLSLLDKVQIHFEKARGEVLGSLQTLYKNFEPKLPHSSDIKKDKIIYCNLGRSFLVTCSPQAIYYGRYINGMNQSIITDVFEAQQSNKKRKKGT